MSSRRTLRVSEPGTDLLIGGRETGERGNGGGESDEEEERGCQWAIDGGRRKWKGEKCQGKKQEKKRKGKERRKRSYESLFNQLHFFFFILSSTYHTPTTPYFP
jgi:hypothetical protein